MSSIRVLIVDDSLFVRKALLRIFEDNESTEVVGMARNGREAIQMVATLNPDVVTMDIMMPIMDGIETLKIIMDTKPTPVLMLSQFTHEGAELTLNALDIGAVDFIDKSLTGLMDFSALAEEIISKVKAIAGRKPRGISLSTSVPEEFRGRNIIDAVAIGTSTGGPPALQVLLTKFPRDISFGILVVQHMPPGFTGPLARRLDAMCEISVKEAEEGDTVEPGLALLGPSGLHMKVIPADNPNVKDYKVKLDLNPADMVHRPSVDVLFRSVAESYGCRSIGVILTGMGSDGVNGLRMIKEKGGTTLAQDEATSTIFGMPKVAIENGVVDKVVPITAMTKEILKRV